MYMCVDVFVCACVGVCLCVLVLNVYMYVKYVFILKCVDYNRATTVSFEVFTFLSVSIKVLETYALVLV